MKRILFVDDEPRILDGLRRALRGKRNEWDMVFAVGGPEAIEMMETAPADVVVSDMRMPGMDGVELLTTVMNRWPQAIRIVLSGHADRAAILRVVGPTHQYLSKPSTPEMIRSTIERATALRDMLCGDALINLVSQMNVLPSAPSLYQELVVRLQDEDVSVSGLAEIIERDVGMSVTILKLVNSAFFGVRTSESNVERAIAMLGVDTVLALVLAGTVFREFDGKAIPSFSIEGLWKHGLRSAQCAAAISTTEAVDQDTRDDLFTAAMLHDAGKLVLAANRPSEYAQVIEECAESPWQTSQIERRVLGATHGEVGAYLLGLWGLPDPVVEAVAYHDSPYDGDFHDFLPVGLVHFADLMASAPSVRDPNDLECEASVTYLGKLGLAHRWSVWQAACEAGLNEGVSP